MIYLKKGKLIGKNADNTKRRTEHWRNDNTKRRRLTSSLSRGIFLNYEK